MELVGLRKALSRHSGDEIELAIPLARGDAHAWGRSSTRPASRSTARRPSTCSRGAPIGSTSPISRPSTTWSWTARSRWTSRSTAVERVVGYSEGLEAEQEFRPFYCVGRRRTAGSRRTATSAIRREPRALSEGSAATARGPATSAPRCSLVAGRSARGAVLRADPAARGGRAGHQPRPAAPDAGRERRATSAWPSPRRSTASGVCADRAGRGPAIPEGEIAWRLIKPPLAQLPDRRRISTTSRARRRCASSWSSTPIWPTSTMPDAVSRRQAQGVRRVAVTPRTRRLPVPGPIVFARGLEIRLTVDEAAFAGASAFLLGAVLEQLFGRLASMNTFTELVAGVRDDEGDQAVAATDGRAAARVALFAALARAPWIVRLLPGAAAHREVCSPTGRVWARRCARRTSRCAVSRRPPWRSRRRRCRRSRSRRRPPPRLEQRFFGLLGPNGPLPLHLTEYARERLRPPRRRHAARGSSTSSTIGSALFFYRAWAEARPDRSARPARRGPVRRVRRIARRIRARPPARSRHRARPRQAVLRRAPGAEREERRGPRVDPGGLLPACRRAWSSSCWAGSSCRRTSEPSWVASRDSRRRSGSGTGHRRARPRTSRAGSGS